MAGSLLLNLQPIVDAVAQNLEIISKNSQLGTRRARTRIFKGLVISTKFSRGTNRKFHGQNSSLSALKEKLEIISRYRSTLFAISCKKNGTARLFADFCFLVCCFQ